MTLRHIRIFVEIYRTCNITRASAVLHMTQPAVTRALQELEQTYNIRLFERMYHRLIPTEGARQLYPQALYLLESFDRIEDELKSWDEHGLLRVGATVTLGSAMLPGLVKRFAELYPKTRPTAAPWPTLYVRTGWTWLFWKTASPPETSAANIWV